MTEPLSILLIEDEPLIAMMLEDFVDVLGHQVCGAADSVAGALEIVATGGCDVAILDVNLRDGPCWPVADALAANGIPFVIATGGMVDPPPPAHARARQLAKPYTMESVRTALEAITA